MTNAPQYSVIQDVSLAEECTIRDHVNLYGCDIGAGTKVDAFVYIEEGVVVGKNCSIRPFVFIPTGVEIGNRVFVGPGVTFTNDRYPSVNGNWELEETVIKDGVGIGAGAVITPGITIGEGSLIGAGSVVTRDVPPETTVIGCPARPYEP